ncbi:amidohydrolase family protein [Dyadobacter chenhuakuii]|uniref:Amidohydrolase family protein n=1 Tax=Dyadobacter chenhuakuii TaxID=2909339 RepID=A0A9X1QA92_9BACT|nr:amidohydrolase family protein [Dyadobacter chenhuakuii]MCF2492317.1 amidohydrolase family protein [Dyadobacter chenhuakuii]MCF2497251.1 amidohydrolase family protein [Dyadobacter chenhuakuii]USJ33378.1 amidohydrolase family protein [Dyadobacter chenhuakuii]
MIKHNIKRRMTGLLLGIAACVTTGNAQNPAPAVKQTKMILVTGATIHVGDGQVIENGSIAFDNGIITAVGTTGSFSGGNGAEVIDAKGKHIYPGIISLNTTVGLQEIASVRATLDYNEVGQINPHVRALVAYNTDSEVIPTLRGNGILLSQAVPQGGVISGSSSVFYSDGWNWEDAVLVKDDGIWLSWPPFLSSSFNYEDFTVSVKRNDKRAEAINVFRSTFADARAYAETQSPGSVNLRLAAMKPLFDGSANLYIRAEYGKDIIEAVNFAKENGVKKIVIVGGDESYKVAAFLKENQIPVVLNPTHRLPGRVDEQVYLPYELPGMLHKAGVKVAITYADEWWRTRNLAFLAGTSSGFGNVTPEEALQFVTKNAAEIIGADKLVGTLEKGKQASFLVTAGDMLDMRGNVIQMAFIKGGKVNLDDKQKRLYEKYKVKYGKK